jgi:hypothetical protein
MRLAGHVTCGRDVYRILVGKPEWKRPLGRHRHRWEDDIRMGLWKTAWEWTGCIWLRIGTSGEFL